MLAGTAFSGLALALPFARFPVIGAVDGFGADAWPALLPLAPAVLGAVLGDRTHGVRPLIGAISLVLACAGLLFAVIKVADAFLATRHVAGSSFGAGAPVLVAAVAAVVAGAALALRSPTA
ncbi:MAG: hypothetical protein A2Z12_08555 [Actinobacteria bacterium RBG_16_68_21]|nr:MAG: hypothetical protein A2Z12_08555 [Actinobacteria bacterium RBG_16_68_21]